MNEPKPGMEFELRRHPEKSGTELKTPSGEKTPLPKEGIQQAQAEGKKFADRIKEIPKAVVFGFTSNVPRTQEAGYIWSEELRYMAKQLPDSRVFDLQKEGSLDQIASQVDDSVDKVIVINSPAHTGLGGRKWNMEAVQTRTKELGGEPNALRKWMVDPELQQEFGVTPEQIAQETRSWIQEQQDTATRLFPGRPVIITGIGHAFELDTAIAALMGKEFAESTVDEMGGKLINTMEGARIVIDETGKGAVEYRDMKADLDLGEEAGERKE